MTPATAAPPLSPAASPAPPGRPARAAVPVDTTWSLHDLFASRADWTAAFEAVDQAREALPPLVEALPRSAADLLACLEAQDALQVRLVRVAAWAHLRNAQDGSDPQHQADAARVAALAARVAAGCSAVDAAILDLPDGTLQRCLAAEPGLADFSVHLADLQAQRPHRLGAEAERALAALGEVLAAPATVYNRSKSGDLQFPPFIDDGGVLQANALNRFESSLESHGSTAVRRAAWASFSTGLKGFNHTYAATFAAEVSKTIALARLRRHASAEHLLLQPHKIPHAVYSRVLDILLAGLAPHMQRLARLRQRVLGLDRLLVCDLKAPLEPDRTPPVSYDAACRQILEALAVMGPDYCATAQATLTRRWVDRADNIGKSSGAFCATPYGVHPFILITWSDTMRNMFTLAHELGHGGHFSLAMRHQRMVNTRPAMPFVEAPSILNELLLAQHLLARTNDAPTRRAVILQVLGTYHHNFVTHLLEAELQRQVFALAEAGQSVTAALLNERKGAILARFWGDTVEIDDGARMTWMRQPHYYMGLYPYTYAVGLVAATAMAQKVRQEGAPAVQRWLQVLQAGGTRPPLELLRLAGIDLDSPQPIHDAVAEVGQLVQALERSFDLPPPAA